MEDLGKYFCLVQNVVGKEEVMLFIDILGM